MITKVLSDEDINLVINYIGENYKEVPYLYLNISKYGTSNKNILSWIDENDSCEIVGVYLVYFDCIHFYTRDVNNYPIDAFLKFIYKIDHKVLMLQGDFGDRLELFTNLYHSERNHIFDMSKANICGKYIDCSIASREEISEIVDLLMEDSEYYTVYNKDILLSQMLNRFDTAFSRYFIVKKDNKVVASCSTYAEFKNLSILGGVIVHPNYRRRGLAQLVEKYAFEILKKENKLCILFVNYNNYASLSLHQKMNAIEIGTLAKFVKR